MTSYLPSKDRAEREKFERWKAFGYDELVARDTADLDITWLRDESLEDADNLPAPEVIAREIVDRRAGGVRGRRGCTQASSADA